MTRICLITPHHISFQPRTLREADILYDEGYDVRVICRQTDRALTLFDQDLMRVRKWRLQPVDLHRDGPQRGAWFVESVKIKLMRLFFEAGFRTIDVASRGYVKGLGRLMALAMEEPADWFIAHTQAALPIAVAAARHWKARLGFDCEDLLAETNTDPTEMVRTLEKTFLPLCDYVSVPSECFANRLVRDYGIQTPLILYNTFPLSLADGLIPPERRSPRSVLRLHWFGQTIGPDRGIEEAIEAMGLIGSENVELHLRGRLREDYRSTIESLARRHRVSSKVTFNPPVNPENLINAMGQFDVGLALERPGHGSYSRTVTNKVFNYLMAGLVVAATDTPGQRELLEQIPSAGFLYPAGDPKILADRLREWIINPGKLHEGQQAAWEAARQKFCWDREKEKLLGILKTPSRRHIKQEAPLESR